MDIAVTLTVDARPVDLTEVNLTRPGGGDVPGDTMYDADSVLFVDVQRADAGEYTLTSSNAAGLGSGSFTLDVQCKLLVYVYIHIRRWQSHAGKKTSIIPSFILIELLHSKCTTIGAD